MDESFLNYFASNMIYLKETLVQVFSCTYCKNFKNPFLDTQLWPEGFYELGSVHLSFCPEVFLGLTHKFFSGTQYGVRGPCGLAYDRVGLSGGNVPKIGFFEFIGKFSY